MRTATLRSDHREGTRSIRRVAAGNCLPMQGIPMRRAAASRWYHRRPTTTGGPSEETIDICRLETLLRQPTTRAVARNTHLFQILEPAPVFVEHNAIRRSQNANGASAAIGSGQRRLYPVHLVRMDSQIGVAPKRPLPRPPPGCADKSAQNHQVHRSASALA